MKPEKVLFAEYSRDKEIQPDNVHSVFADVIKMAKERIKERLTVTFSEFEFKERTGGTLLKPVKQAYTTVELKLTAKIPIE